MCYHENDFKNWRIDSVFMTLSALFEFAHKHYATLYEFICLCLNRD